VQDRIAMFLGLQTIPTHSFQVMVGNGQQITCSLVCLAVPLQFGPHNLSVDMFVLPLSGAEIVLGIQWLKTLALVLTDYEALTMKFVKDGQLVQLEGLPKPLPSEASLHQLKRMLHTDPVSQFFHIQIFTSSSITTPHVSTLNEIQ